MKSLKSLIASVALTLILAATVLADGTCNPGEVNTPPCTSAPVSSEDPDPDSVNPPPASDSVDIAWLVETALESLLLL